MRHPIPATILAGAALLAAPAGTSADAGAVTPTLVSPPAACYSATFADSEDSRTFTSVGPLEFSGPPNSSGELTLRSARGPLEGSYLQFDEAGRFSLPRFPIRELIRVGPGEPADLGVRSGGQESVVGSTKLTRFGLRVGAINSGLTSSARPQSIAVSGTPFANKTLYGFVVEYKKRSTKTKGGSTNGDPARNSRKVLRRFTLGKGDECGYVTKKEVLRTRKAGHDVQLYVSASPKLDRTRAIFPTIGS